MFISRCILLELDLLNVLLCCFTSWISSWYILLELVLLSGFLELERLKVLGGIGGLEVALEVVRCRASFLRVLAGPTL